MARIWNLLCADREKRSSLIWPKMPRGNENDKSPKKKQNFFFLIVCYYDQQIGSPEIGDVEKLPVDLDLFVSGNWN
jgi:hypothetical protein